MDTTTPKNIQSLLDTADAQRGKQQWAEASENYQRFLAHEPGNEGARANLGFCLIKLGQADRGIYELQQALAINPKNGRTLMHLALAFGDGPQCFESIPYRRRLVEVLAADPHHACDLANQLLSAGRIAEAITYYRRAIEVAPDYKTAVANYLLAINYSDELSPLEIACEHFRLAQRWAGKRCPPKAFA
jgi:tetratricopeptide (TPR) repeat protein